MWGDKPSDRPPRQEARRRASLFRERVKAIAAEIALPRTKDDRRRHLVELAATYSRAANDLL
jgi:hypothetical protein